MAPLEQHLGDGASLLGPNLMRRRISSRPEVLKSEMQHDEMQRTQTWMKVKLDFISCILDLKGSLGPLRFFFVEERIHPTQSFKAGMDWVG